MLERSRTDLKVYYRPMKTNDAQSLLDIANLSQVSKWSLKMFEEEIHQPLSLSVIAEINQEPVGFGICRLVQGDAQLIEFAVHPDFRNKSVGEKLLKNIIGRLRRDGGTKVHLEVRIDNDSAKQCYEKVGFKSVGIRKNFYHQNGAQSTDAVIMTCELN